VEEDRVTDILVDRLVVKRGTRHVLDEVTLHVAENDRIAIIGPNGAGKTTLMRAILGLETASSGQLTLDGIPASRLSPLERAAKLAWLPQQALVDEPITALEFVLAARYRFRESAEKAGRAALSTLESAGAASLANRVVTRLSGGERQRVALAALLAQDAATLLLDEPANHLDPAQQVSVWRLMSQAAAKCTIIVVTHDINLVALLGDLSRTRILALDQGRVAFDTLANDPSLPERLTALYRMRMQVFDRGEYRMFMPHFGAEPGP